MIELAASILSANFACLGAEAQAVVEVVVFARRGKKAMLH